MPVFHIIAVGQPGSGKSEILRHFANNLPEGFKLKLMRAEIPNGYGQEYWVMVVLKDKRKKKNDLSRVLRTPNQSHP